MPMQAMPAPMYFAATGSMRKLLLEVGCSRFGSVGSVTRVNGVVEVDAGEDREHVSLQERDEQLQRGQRDHKRQWQRRTGGPYDTEAAKQGNEARKHFEGDMAGQHVGEQSDA